MILNVAIRRRANRSSAGFSLLELVVALSILVTLLSVSSRMIVRHTRLMSTQQKARIALDELSNQLELLTGLTVDEAESQIEGLQLSGFASERLPQAELNGEIFPPAEEGSVASLTLQLVWGAERQRGRPLELTTWLQPEQSTAPSPTESTVEAEEAS